MDCWLFIFAFVYMADMPMVDSQKIPSLTSLDCSIVDCSIVDCETKKTSEFIGTNGTVSEYLLKIAFELYTVCLDTL